MTVIDSHHHFWWMSKRQHRWPEGADAVLERDYTPDDMRPELRAAGVDGTVLIQVAHDTAETLEYLDLASDSDFVRGVVGWAPLTDPDSCLRAVDEFAGRGKLVGIRHLISNEPDPKWLLQDGVVESLKMLSEKGLAFDAIPVNPAQLESVLDVAGKLPDLRIVINHLGRPPVPEQGWEPWATLIARAAECRNVSIKLSAGLDIVLRWKWSTDEIAKYVEHVLDLFGPNRVMAASNWPVVLLGGSFAQVWSGIVALTAALPNTERQMVLGGTALRVYGL
jgi:L-fuconolactonase